MIKVLFFARVRDQLGVDRLQVELPEGINSLLQFTAHLVATHPSFAGIIDDPAVLVAVNQTLAHSNASIQDGDEIAYFPPVSGG